MLQRVKRRLRTADVIEAAVVGLFTLWVAWPFIDPRGFLSFYDTFTYSGPNTVATYRAWAEHRLPLWNPDMFGGTAFAANLQTAVFYPLKLIAWPLGAARSMQATTAVHLFVLAFGMRAVARKALSLAAPAGAVAALVVVGGSSVMTRAVQFEQIAVVAWIPWALVTVDGVIAASASPDRGRRLRSIANAAAVLTMLVLAGHPNQVYLAAAVIGVWTAVRLVDRRPAPEPAQDGAGTPARPVVRAAGMVGAAAALAVGMLATVVVLAVPLLRSASPLGYDAAVRTASDTGYILHRRYLATTLLGDPLVDVPTVASDGFENLGSVGVGAAVLAAVGLVAALVDRQRRLRVTAVALAALAAVTIVLAFGPQCAEQRCEAGGALYRLAATIIPGFASARVPGRWLTVLAIAVAILAAIGADALARRRLAARDAAVAAAIVIAGGSAVAMSSPQLAPMTPGLPVIWLATAAVTLAAIGAAVASPRRWAGVALAIAAVVPTAVIGVELGVPQRANLARSSRTDRPFDSFGTALTDRLARSGERFLSLTEHPLDDPAYTSGVGSANAFVTYGATSVDGYDGGLWLTKPWTVAARALAPVYDRNIPPGWQLRTPIDPSLLARFGVRWLVVDHEVAMWGPGLDWATPVFTDGPFALYENPAYAGRAIRYSRVAEISGDEEAMARALRAADPATATVDAADGHVVEGLGCDGPVSCATVPAQIVRDDGDEVVVRTAGDREGLVVLADQRLPGWSAAVDGDDVPTVAANGLGMGVRVGPGDHEITFRYRPPLLGVGLAVSLAALGATAALWCAPVWLPRLRNRRRGTPAVPASDGEVPEAPAPERRAPADPAAVP